MKHMECEDCKLRNGDCGYHFKMDGKTNYDIPSLTACDRYGNCEFFQQKDRPQGDLISREWIKDAFEDCTGECACCVHNTNDFKYCGLIDNAPTVPQAEFNLDELCRLRSDLKTGAVVGSTLRYQFQIDRYIKAIDDVIGAVMKGGKKQ